MKPILILVLILFSGIAFGQSAKKLNYQLRAELVAEQDKQEVAYKKFTNDWALLELVRKDFKDSVKRKLEPEDRKLRKLRFEITASDRTIKDLGISSSDVFSGELSFDSHPDYKKFIRPLDEALNKSVKFLFVPEDGFKLDDYNRKEQNELLKGLIKKYQTYEQYNRVYFQDQKEYIQQIEAFRPRIDSLYEVYKRLNAELEKQAALVTKKIEAARENYRLKGPENFPIAYGFIFPDVHPVTHQAEENIPEETDLGHSDVFSRPISDVPVAVEELNMKIYEFVDEVAAFPGGMEALEKYMNSHLNYPPVAKERGVSGKVYLQFVVSDKGVITDVVVKRGIMDCKECDVEAIRLVKSMPNWIPAKKAGKNVHSYFSLPVIFKL